LHKIGTELECNSFIAFYESQSQCFMLCSLQGFKMWQRKDNQWHSDWLH